MRWLKALQLWNGKDSELWSIPRVGTGAYEEVRRIMEGEPVGRVAKESSSTPVSIRYKKKTRVARVTGLNMATPEMPPRSAMSV